MNKDVKYFSLFTGIGGFELGIQQAYESNIKRKHISKKSKQKKRTQRRIRTTDKHKEMLCSTNRSAPLCVGYSEIDVECDKCKREGRGKIQPKTLISKTRVKCDTCGAEKEHAALQIFEKHYPNIKNYGDCTKINVSELPKFEILIGGFPCQSFSIAGKRGGFKDTRGTLFFEIARIAKAKRPRLLFLENVKGLLSHNEGNTFATIISTLDELGYDCQWQVLNSKNFGVPQNRERVFIIGHLRGTSRPKVFPIGEGKKGIIQNGKKKKGQTYSWALRGRDYKDGTNFIATYRHSMKGFKGYADMSPSIKSSVGSGNQILINKIRRLTPTECERLQGFPDGWTEGVSDTQRYKILGNAVTVNVIKAIMVLINKQ